MPVSPIAKAAETIGGMTPITTPLQSAEIKRDWSERIKAQSVFSARTTEQSYIDMVKERLQAVASRTDTPQVVEDGLRIALRNLGYTPANGFPGDRARHGSRIPPATPGSITDLSSSRRIQLVLDTNVKQARSLGQMATSDNPVFLMANPAWKLERTGARKKPRADWKRRWQAAGEACRWQGAAKKQMVALKDSPIWAELGRGAGDFRDAIGSPYPPFAFGSGLAWTNVGRRAWQRICAQEGIPDGLEAVAEKAKALKRAQEAEGGAGAYGASAIPGTLGRGLAERLAAPPVIVKPPPPFVPDMSAMESARRAIDVANAIIATARSNVEAHLAEVRTCATNAKSEVALHPGAPTDSLVAKFSNYERHVKEFYDDVKRIAMSVGSYSSSVSSAETPKDEASQRSFDVEMKRHESAAKNTKRDVEDLVAASEKFAKAARKNLDAVRKKIDEWLVAECAKVVDEAEKYIKDAGCATSSDKDDRMHALQKRITDAKAEAKRLFGKAGA